MIRYHIAASCKKVKRVETDNHFIIAQTIFNEKVWLEGDPSNETRFQKKKKWTNNYDDDVLLEQIFLSVSTIFE